MSQSEDVRDMSRCFFQDDIEFSVSLWSTVQELQ